MLIVVNSINSVGICGVAKGLIRVCVCGGGRRRPLPLSSSFSLVERGGESDWWTDDGRSLTPRSKRFSYLLDLQGFRIYLILILDPKDFRTNLQKVFVSSIDSPAKI